MIVYAIPITIFLVLYTKIILTLRKRQQSQVGELYQRSPILETANHQMTRMVVVVEVVFILCLSWDSWFYLLGDIGINYVFNSKYQVIGVFLATFNSVANPFVYSATMSRFRQNLKKTLRCGEQIDNLTLHIWKPRTFQFSNMIYNTQNTNWSFGLD